MIISVKSLNCDLRTKISNSIHSVTYENFQKKRCVRMSCIPPFDDYLQSTMNYAMKIMVINKYYSLKIKLINKYNSMKSKLINKCYAMKIILINKYYSIKIMLINKYESLSNLAQES